VLRLNELEPYGLHDEPGEALFRKPILLSPPAEWPRGRRAAKRRNELSSLDVRPFAQHERIVAAKLAIPEGRILARKPSILRGGEACLAPVQQAAEDGGR
jgi:hypothetical protein